MTEYYKTKKEALQNRCKGDRLYYSTDRQMYYLVKPKRYLTFFDFIGK